MATLIVAVYNPVWDTRPPNREPTSPEEYTHFFSDPPDAEITQIDPQGITNKRLVGRTNTYDAGKPPINLELFDFKGQGDDAVVTFFIEKPGYKSRSVTVSKGELLGSEFWPPLSQEVPRLQPESSLAETWRRHPVALPSIPICLALSVVFWSFKEREVKRLRDLESSLAQAGDDPYVGRTLGEYTVEIFIGAGGAGRVYKARAANGRRFAIKILPYEDVDPTQVAQTRGRFEREMTLLKDLRHSNVGAILDFGSTPHADWILMPHYDGGDLSARLTELEAEQQKLPHEELLTYAEDIAAGLQTVHDLDICHRDVKPGNVMLHQGHAILIDFGIARGAQDKTMTEMGATVGTPLYLPPEQIDQSRVTDRADQYSYGLILCRMLTGKLPFRSESTNPFGIMAEKLYGLVPVRELDPELGEEMESFFARILDKEPSNRFASVSEAFQAFEAALRRSSEVLR